LVYSHNVKRQKLSRGGFIMKKLFLTLGAIEIAGVFTK
jgi:hypothetical protein